MLELIPRIRDDFARLDRRILFALIYSAVGLTCINFLKDPAYLETLLRQTPLAEIEANMLRANQAKQQWAATYGPWLGFAGGLTVAAIIAGVFGGVFQGVVNGK
jgi:hypothetical protein